MTKFGQRTPARPKNSSHEQLSSRKWSCERATRLPLPQAVPLSFSPSLRHAMLQIRHATSERIFICSTARFRPTFMNFKRIEQAVGCVGADPVRPLHAANRPCMIMRCEIMCRDCASQPCWHADMMNRDDGGNQRQLLYRHHDRLPTQHSRMPSTNNASDIYRTIAVSPNTGVESKLLGSKATTAALTSQFPPS
jgi:hypothetical protein